MFTRVETMLLLFYGDPAHPNGIVPGETQHGVPQVIGGGCTSVYLPDSAETLLAPGDTCANYKPTRADLVVVHWYRTHGHRPCFKFNSLRCA